MIIYSVFIVNKSGGLIYNLDNNVPIIEYEKSFSAPLDIVLDYSSNNKITVQFNQRDRIKGLRLKEIKIFYKINKFNFSWPPFGCCQWTTSKWLQLGGWQRC